MKKQTGKLALHRETLRSLTHPAWMKNVQGGGDTQHSACLSLPRACGTGDGGGGIPTATVCSNDCATGGACTT